MARGEIGPRGQARLRLLAAAVAAISICATGCTASGSGGHAPSTGHVATTSPPSPSSSPELAGPATGSLIAALKNPSFSSDSLAFSKDGKRLAVGTALQVLNIAGGYAYVWDIATRKIIATFEPQSPLGVFSVAFSPDGGTLAIQNGASEVEAWDVGSHAEAGDFTQPDQGSGFTAMASQPGGSLVAVADDTGTVYLWNPGTDALAATLTNSDVQSSVALAWGPQGDLLAVSDEDGDVYVWDIPTKTLFTGVTIPDGGQVAALAFSPEGSILAAGTTKGDIYLYDTVSYRLQGELTAAKSKAVTALAYAPGGVILAAGYANGTTALWDTTTEQATAHLSVPGSGNAVESLAFSRDASLLAVANQARSTYLWHITELS